MNKPLGLILGTMLAAGTASASQILYDFTGATATGDGATAALTSNDFGSGVTASVFTLVNGNGSGSFVDGFHNNRLEIVLKGVQTTSQFAVTIPGGVVVNLTQLDFDDGIRWTTSRSNSTYSQWTVAIDNGGSATPSAVDAVRTSAENVGEQSRSNSMALSGLTGLTGTTVNFTIYGQFGIDPPPDFTNGNDQTRQAFIDNLSLTGTVVPEPASLSLLGFCALGLFLRRLRT